MGDNGTTAFVVSSQDRSYHILLDAGSGAARALENYLDVLELNAGLRRMPQLFCWIRMLKKTILISSLLSLN